MAGAVVSKSSLEAQYRENNSLRLELKRLRADPGDIPFTACDNSCVVCDARGMSTNGGCRCDERKLRAAVMWWRRRAQFLQATIITTRDCDMCQSAPGFCPRHNADTWPVKS